MSCFSVQQLPTERLQSTQCQRKMIRGAVDRTQVSLQAVQISAVPAHGTQHVPLMTRELKTDSSHPI